MKNLHTFEEFLNESKLNESGYKDSKEFFSDDDKNLNDVQKEIANLLSVKKDYKEKIITADAKNSMRGRNGLAFDFLTKSWKSDLSKPLVIDDYTLDFDKRRVVKVTDSAGTVNYFWVMQSKFNWG